jgi:uncharacterized OB-fold protein
MAERRPAVPGLYAIDDGGSPSLYGRRCLDCGYVFFPPHAFGCEVCGALPERTEPIALAGRGVLRSFAVVHRHGGGDAGTPLIVGEIALDAGPTVRAVLHGGEELAIGDRMRSVLWPAPSPGTAEEKIELRFEKAAGAAENRGADTRAAESTGTAKNPGAA